MVGVKKERNFERSLKTQNTTRSNNIRAREKKHYLKKITKWKHCFRFLKARKENNTNVRQ